MHYNLDSKRVWIAGHRGMVGSALVRRLESENCTILLADRSKLDLEDQHAVRSWINRERPDAIIIAAAKVGGIWANSQFPADFIYSNLAIETNIIEAAHRADVNRLLFLGSSCIYPKFADQPITEDALLTGALEPTNQWYAIAKIAGIKLCEAFRVQYGRDYISAMPTNLYGPHDNFDLVSSHVLPALLRKAHEAKSARAEKLTIWGTGTPKREFLYVDDCADACAFLLKRYSEAIHINIGSGSDVSIAELATLITSCVGYHGMLDFDRSKPDGTPRKLMSVERLSSLGWSCAIDLPMGIQKTYDWFLSSQNR